MVIEKKFRFFYTFIPFLYIRYTLCILFHTSHTIYSRYVKFIFNVYSRYKKYIWTNFFYIFLYILFIPVSYLKYTRIFLKAIILQFEKLRWYFVLKPQKNIYQFSLKKLFICIVRWTFIFSTDGWYLTKISVTGQNNLHQQIQ